MRDRVRELIQTMIESDLEAVLSRPRYARQPEADPENDGAGSVTGHRHGHRSRSLLGTFGRVEIAVPRARLDTAEGKTTKWKSTALRAYQRRTRQADLLIVGAYLSGTNTRRVRRALAAVFGGAVSKDTVSRVWRKVKSDWDAWNCPLAGRGTDCPLDPRWHGGAGPARPQGDLDRAAGRARVREDGQKVLLAVKNMGGETSEAWRAVLDDLGKRGLRRPEFLMVDGEPGWSRRGRAVGRCANPALHRPQAPQPLAPRAPAAARRGLSRLQRHDLQDLGRRDRGAPPHLPAQMAAQMQGGSRQPRGSR